MKMLEGAGGVSAEKYSTLHDMIFLELHANRETVAQRQWGQYYSLVGSDGRSIPKDEVSCQVRAFATSLNWLAIRTAFYTLFSYNYKADAMLHPIRSDFQFSLAGRLGLPGNAFAPIIRRFSDATAQVVKEITVESEPVVAEMDIPLFSAWLVGKTGSPRAAIAAAFDMRNDKPLSEARLRFADLEHASGEPSRKNFVRDVNRLVREVKEAGHILRKLYAVETKNGVPLSPLISIYNVLGTPLGLPPLPSFPLKVTLPDKVLEIKIRRGFKGVCRSVVQDLVAVARLGEYHEKLTARCGSRTGSEALFSPRRRTFVSLAGQRTGRNRCSKRTRMERSAIRELLTRRSNISVMTFATKACYPGCGFLSNYPSGLRLPLLPASQALRVSAVDSPLMSASEIKLLFR
jgi:hypothetical protein